MNLFLYSWQFEFLFRQLFSFSIQFIRKWDGLLYAWSLGPKNIFVYYWNLTILKKFENYASAKCIEYANFFYRHQFWRASCFSFKYLFSLIRRSILFSFHTIWLKWLFYHIVHFFAPLFSLHILHHWQK